MVQHSALKRGAVPRGAVPQPPQQAHPPGADFGAPVPLGAGFAGAFASTTLMVPLTMPIQQLNWYWPGFVGVNSLTLVVPGVNWIWPENRALEMTALVQPEVPVSLISHLTGSPAFTVKSLGLYPDADASMVMTCLPSAAAGDSTPLEALVEATREGLKMLPRLGALSNTSWLLMLKSAKKSTTIAATFRNVVASRGFSRNLTLARPMIRSIGRVPRAKKSIIRLPCPGLRETSAKLSAVIVKPQGRKTVRAPIPNGM